MLVEKDDKLNALVEKDDKLNALVEKDEKLNALVEKDEKLNALVDEDEKLNALVENPNIPIIDIFVYCGGKCGGSTLINTFYKNEYKTLHLHTINCKGFLNYIDFNINDIHDILNESCKNKDIYIIDSYRTPIERKISSFFQNISLDIPNYESLSVEEIIDVFNRHFITYSEEYHPINEPLLHYDIPLFTKFDFEKKYNIVKKDNKIFIKILFKDIKEWDKILSEIFGKEIIIYPLNLTENKDVYELYQKFKSLYKVPKTYIDNVLMNDTEFKIYNTKEEQEEYIKKWLSNSY